MLNNLPWLDYGLILVWTVILTAIIFAGGKEIARIVQEWDNQ